MTNENGIVPWYERGNWGDWESEQTEKQEPERPPEIESVDYGAGFAGNVRQEIEAASSDAGKLVGRNFRNYLVEGFAEWVESAPEEKVPKEDRGPGLGRRAASATGRAAVAGAKVGGRVVAAGARAGLNAIFDWWNNRNNKGTSSTELGFPNEDVVEAEFRVLDDENS